MSKKQKLHAYLVTFKNAKFEIPTPVTKMVLAYSKEESHSTFIKWLKGIEHYNGTVILTIQTARKNKANARFYNEDYYIKQNMHVDSLYDAYIRKVAN